jgi:NADH:ubiquinone oxidoreductase subunit F (NADH-binding)
MPLNTQTAILGDLIRTAQSDTARVYTISPELAEHIINNINEFYAHESCGQCTPCREGAQWMKKITDRIVAGGGVDKDPETLKNVADNIAGKTICAFGPCQNSSIRSCAPRSFRC